VTEAKRGNSLITLSNEELFQKTSFNMTQPTNIQLYQVTFKFIMLIINHFLLKTVVWPFTTHVKSDPRTLMNTHPS